MAGTDHMQEELAYRIHVDIAACAGVVPERYARAWHGYLAGLVEWSVIDLPTYRTLIDLLPRIDEPNPILTIFSGRDEHSPPT